MHFSIPETENLQDKDGSYYQVKHNLPITFVIGFIPFDSRLYKARLSTTMNVYRNNQVFNLFQGYHVHINGNHHCTLRYKQLRHLHDQLKKLFSHDTIPDFPSKKLLPLTTLQLEERRLYLEKYLQSRNLHISFIFVCAIKILIQFVPLSCA